MASGSFSVPPAPEVFGPDTIVLMRDGHDSLEVDKNQITPGMVARAFDLDPSTVWLKERGGQRAFFPDANNLSFNFCSDVGTLWFRFNVEGSPPQPSGSNSVSRLSFVQPSPSMSRNPLVAHSTGRRAAETTINVKVVLAKMKRTRNGKPDFTSHNVTYIDVTETTANVNFLTNAMQNKWGHEYIIVSSEGLPIEDSSGTQGVKFWKVGSRKPLCCQEE